MYFFRQFLVASVMCFCPGLVAAEDVLLTFQSQGDTQTYSRSQLEELEPVTFETTTIWTEGSQTFTGVPLANFLAANGIMEGTFKAYAINDYAVEIPVSDGVEGGPIIAYDRNGGAMTVRDKGPLWLVYPYDSNPAYQSEVIYSRSIWQLDRIEIIQ